MLYEVITDVEALLHPERAHGIVNGVLPDVEGECGTHCPGELESVLVHIRDHDVPGAHEAHHGDGHDSDRSSAGNQNILSDDIEGERRVNRVAQGIEDGSDLVVDCVRQLES